MEQLRAAVQLVYGGRFLQAEAGARQVLARQPRNAEAHYVLALSAMFQNRHAEALPPVDRAIALDGANAQYPFVRALCLAGAGRLDEAIAGYRRALALRPAFFEAWANLGNLLEKTGRFPEAREAYGAALKLRPADPLVLNGLGMCHLASADLPRAAEAFQRAVAADPGQATLRNNLCHTLGKLGQYDASIAHGTEAVRLRPDYFEAWLNLGEACYKAGRDSDAVAALDRALGLDPGNDGLRHLRDSIAGVQTGRAPDDYIRNVFDRSAADFDRHLVGDLEYRTPQKMAQFLAPWLAGREGKLRIEDLGCGTGLSGVVLKPYAARLAGVDLSGQMLARARERGLYDSLHEAEIAAYLDGKPAGGCDLAAAMDVFVYLGDLGEVFRAVARTLAPAGLFAFSVERLASDDRLTASRGRAATPIRRPTCGPSPRTAASSNGRSRRLRSARNRARPSSGFSPPSRRPDSGHLPREKRISGPISGSFA